MCKGEEMSYDLCKNLKSCKTYEIVEFCEDGDPENGTTCENPETVRKIDWGYCPDHGADTDEEE